MASFRKLPVCMFIAGLGFGPMVAVFAEGDATKEPRAKDTAAPAEAKGEAPRQPKRMEIPVPKGQPQKGLRIPLFDPEGRLLYRFEIGVAEVIDDEHVKLGATHVESFKSDGEREFDIDLTDSVYNQKSGDLVSNVRVVIKCSEFELSGNSMTFNIGAKTGKLGNGVKMVIHDANSTIAGKNEKPSGPVIEVKPMKEEPK